MNPIIIYTYNKIKTMRSKNRTSSMNKNNKSIRIKRTMRKRKKANLINKTSHKILKKNKIIELIVNFKSIYN